MGALAVVYSGTGMALLSGRTLDIQFFVRQYHPIARVGWLGGAMDCHDDTDLFRHNCAAEPGPGIHALVIGVSRYAARTRRGQTDFGDIDGTAIGAAQFAAFLARDFHDPDKFPVQTIRLLLSLTDSEDPNLPADAKWAEASPENVLNALNDWYADCNLYPDNIAILYVGGHGLVTTEGASEVFLSGANEQDDPHRVAVNMTITEEVMKYCQAAASIFLYDCCAGLALPKFSESNNGIFPTTRIYPGQVGSVKNPLRITASRTGRPAYAIGAKEGTVFSWALLDVLRTAGEIVQESYFAITPKRLEAHLPIKMSSHPQLTVEEGDTPTVNGDYLPKGISRPDPRPKFQISFVPENAAAVPARLLVEEEETSGKFTWQGEIAGDIVQFPVPAGVYHLQSAINDKESNYDQQKMDRDARYSVVNGKLRKERQ
jgi:hypothetical protein